ncbi:DUF262 domain-containing protein [Oxynema aestuarii]|uniref:DUF262 domain-containing protein n=1 Tax=Oxynema aestuarii AP17 TaxID=2064643 RepID=A0A6H1U3E5_9CYAN|nr:DUF1524 domain-containing protein [Oxynema aestuarii]QIZ73175.1 DUF262 domain-containing protein [Oxynema aestuarii AP17]
MIHSLLDTRTTNFGDLISNGKIYRVPPFQRDYSWNEENWEDLWQDIESLLTEQTPIHYMGAIVLQSSLESDKYFTIIDGQQRLATLSILATVVIDRLETLIANDIDPEANRERQEILRRTYLGDKDPRSLRYSSKLILNNNNNDFYKSNLINLREPRNIRKLTKSNQLLWKAFEYFRDRLNSLTDIIQFGDRLAAFLADTNELERIYNQVAIDIDSQQIDRPREVFEKLRPVYVSDEKFERDFSVLKIETKGQKKKLVRYILAKLENYVSGKPINEETPSIEHILPESPDRQWEQEFTNEQMADMRYRLGNLTFLEPSFNREIGQKKYDIKRQKYQQSSYILTQQITNDDWTPDSIARRQQELARQAIRVWRSDFV